ncbi:MULTISPECIES: hypothetical protein [Staphylococcus]|uniref:hypothetical protein n=1 Tax=Staphylococcus TaxID=1279 RepID=UPI00045058A7|nr:MULTISPECIES: hypothetical protein [Staphylococcus]MBG3415759.1 hypothetical protein [Staphylococcus aureus]OLS06673.1 hypothetical protein AUK68_06350 [Staphylococcus epidermidis]EWR66280.1 hypothetical protein T969_02776 [Staphylococcus aureus FVRH6079]MCE3336760.1 hypothetical protein [Staphylococcus aureus]MDS4063038.1 hypothetical protein [Staphylococcus capitis]
MVYIIEQRNGKVLAEDNYLNNAIQLVIEQRIKKLESLYNSKYKLNNDIYVYMGQLNKLYNYSEKSVLKPLYAINEIYNIYNNSKFIKSNEFISIQTK